MSEYTFLMEKDLYGKAGTVIIEKGPTGFNISSDLELGGGGCGSSCSSGSCSM